jgi:DNA invertase Pin-like site-specific DNA recombinase
LIATPVGDPPGPLSIPTIEMREEPMKIGYARVSTQDQSTDLQLDALKRANCERIFQEKASGAKADRPELAAALEYARAGDTLVVWKLDRLARSMRQLIETVELLRERGVMFESLTEKIDTASAQGQLVFGIFASLAQFERSLIRERVSAGLQAARRRGRQGGRPKVEQGKLAQAVALHRAGYSAKKAAEAAGIGRATLCRHLAVSKTPDFANETRAGFGIGFETRKQGSKLNGSAASA